VHPTYTCPPDSDTNINTKTNPKYTTIKHFPKTTKTHLYVRKHKTQS